MSEPLVLVTLGVPTERAAFVAAAEQLSANLAAAAGRPTWPIQLSLLDPESEPPTEPKPAAIVTSLLCETVRPSEPIEETEARWRTGLEKLQGAGAPVLVANVFRFVSGGLANAARARTTERIRRLNLMAIRLSQQLGVGVIDLDRVLAHIGARAAHSDYRLRSDRAAEVAAFTIARALLSFGIDDAVDPGLQELALVKLGPLSEIDAVVLARIAAKAKAPSPAAAG